jgi:hypothetical protein
MVEAGEGRVYFETTPAGPEFFYVDKTTFIENNTSLSLHINLF